MASEREAFEAWALSEALPVDRIGGEYRWDDVRKRWEGWQARATQQAQPAEQDTAPARGADEVERLRKMVHDAIKTADNVGRSRGMNCYAHNTGAVVSLVDLTAAIDAAFDRMSATPTAPQAAPVQAQPAEQNQCDGCQAGMPLQGGIHRHEGRANMACERSRYEAQPAEQASDGERFRWWFDNGDKSSFIPTYLTGVQERWSLDQWREAIDAARAQTKGDGHEPQA